MASPALLRVIRTIDDPRRTVVSGATYNPLARAVRNMTIEGGSIGLNPLGGIHIQVMPQASPTPTPTPSGGGYDGPFSVAVSNGVATVSAGTIWAGLTKISYAGGTVSVSDGWQIALEITYANSAYSVAVTASNVAYIQTASKYIQILGKYVDGNWQQWWQAGDIQVCGRVV